MTDISEPFRWAGVELRHLITLQTVAEERSLAGAARRLGYSQPAVSQQLAALERLVGSRLVERRAGAREVALTEAGRLALLHSVALLARAQAADAELRALEEGTAGTLRLGAIPSVAARVAPRLLRTFADHWPEVTIELVEHDDDVALLEQVESGSLDLTFALVPVREGPFEVAHVLADGYILAVASDAALATRGRKVSLQQLAELPLIVCSQSAAPEALLRAHGIAAEVRYRIDNNHGHPIRYGYVPRRWPLPAYQNVYSIEPGSAEMASAGRPFTAELITRLVAEGVLVAPVTLHTGVSSPESHERPYPERYRVPEHTARLANAVRAWGGRVIATGTTVVRALETVARPDGAVEAAKAGPISS